LLGQGKEATNGKPAIYPELVEISLVVWLANKGGKVNNRGYARVQGVLASQTFNIIACSLKNYKTRKNPAHFW